MSKCIYERTEEKISSGDLSWTVDLPSLFKQLALESANLENIGPGAAYGFMVAMMKLNNIATIAIRDNNTEILLLLGEMGIIGFDEGELVEDVKNE